MISSTHPAALKFDGITYHYAGTERPAVDAMHLAVNPGELVVLVGPSGCGKSTVLKLVAGLIEPNHGRVFIDGTDMIGLPPNNETLAGCPRAMRCLTISLWQRILPLGCECTELHPQNAKLAPRP